MDEEEDKAEGEAEGSARSMGEKKHRRQVEEKGNSNGKDSDTATKEHALEKENCSEHFCHDYMWDV